MPCLHPPPPPKAYGHGKTRQEERPPPPPPWHMGMARQDKKSASSQPAWLVTRQEGDIIPASLAKQPFPRLRNKPGLRRKLACEGNVSHLRHSFVYNNPRW